MKKKLLSLVLVAGMAVSMLTACNGGSSDAAAPADDAAAVTEAPAEDTAVAEAPADDTSAPAETAEAADGEYDLSKAQGKKIGFAVPTLASDFINYLSQAAVDAFAEIGVDCQIDSCDGDVTTQQSQIENYVQMGMDVIIVFPVNGDALGSVVQNAVDAGVPVFGFAMEIPNVTSEMISAEETVMGAACGDMASEWIDKTFPDAGDGEVIVAAMRGSTQPEIVVRSDSMVEAIKKNSKVTVIEIESENQDDQQVARRMIENEFNKTPDIDVIVACNAESALGCNSFVMSADSPVTDIEHFGIFAVDETTEIDEMIKASINNEQAIRGTISMGGIPDTIADLMKGMLPILCEGEVIPRIDGSIFPITADNVEEALNK